MKLDLLDRKIITQLDLDARQSASQIGRKIGVAKETVNFRIKRLLKNEVIKGFYAIIDTAKIDRFFFKVFIKFNQIKPDRRNEIMDFLSSYSKISQVLLLEGKYDVQLFFLAKGNNELMDFMIELNNMCGKEIKEKEVLIVNEMHRFNLKFLHSEKEEKSYKVGTKRSDYKIDELSFKVLKEITKNARISSLEIAKNLGISAQLAQYHLKKLIKDKVIVSTHVSINYAKLNKLHYHLTWQLNNHQDFGKIIEFFNNSKKSIFATKMIGCYDGSAELIVENSEELRKFIDKLMERFSESINVMDAMLIYSEYELRLYPL